MLQPEIDWQICHACRNCKARPVCKPRALRKSGGDEPARIETARCNSCGKCVLACPFGAILMKDISVGNISRDGCLPSW